jgi:hypothetical protein
LPWLDLIIGRTRASRITRHQGIWGAAARAGGPARIGAQRRLRREGWKVLTAGSDTSGRLIGVACRRRPGATARRRGLTQRNPSGAARVRPKRSGWGPLLGEAPRTLLGYPGRHLLACAPGPLLGAARAPLPCHACGPLLNSASHRVACAR